MQKNKILCFLLAVILLFSNFNLTALATGNSGIESMTHQHHSDEQEETKLSLDDGMELKANNGMGQLLLEDLENAKEESLEETAQAYSISDITVSGSDATVTFNVLSTCTVVVGIYEEETDKMVAYGVKEVTRNSYQTQVEISEGEIPQFYKLKGYVIDDKMRPLSNEYTSDVYTKAMQEFLSKRKEDFDPEKVIELDSKVETNFAVVSEQNTLIRYEAGKNSLASFDESTNTYVFENANEQLKSLKQGDIFVYQYDETDITIIEVADIDIRDETVTIIDAANELSVEEVFEHIRVEKQASSSEAQITQDDCAEGVTYLGKTEDDIVTLNRGRELSTFSDDKTHELEWNPDKFKIDPESQKDYISIVLGISLVFQIKYYYNSEIDFKADINLIVRSEFEGSINVETEKDFDILATAPEISTGPVTVEYTPKFHVGGEVKGSVTGGFDGSFGLEITQNGIKPTRSWTPHPLNFDIALKAEVGIKFAPQIKILGDKIFSLSFEETGVYLEVTAEDNMYDLSLGLDDVASAHDCNVCFSIKITVKVPIQLKLALLGNENILQKILSGSAEIDKELSMDLGEWYLSTPLGFHEGSCPNDLVIINVVVKDTYGNPVKGAHIFTSESDEYVVTSAGGMAQVKSPIKEMHLYASYTDEKGNSTVGSTYFEMGTGNLGSLNSKVPIVLGKLEAHSDNRFVKKITWGYGNYAMITRDNTLYMWGENYHGQLGNRSTTASGRPVKVAFEAEKYKGEHDDYFSGEAFIDIKNYVAKVPQIKDVVISDGCVGAVTTDGKLYMWGDNSYGNLGQGNADLPNSSKPLLVNLPGKVKKLRFGGSMVAVILENNDLYMWGYNYSRLISSTTTRYIYEPTFVMSNVKEISMTASNVAVINLEGNLYIWGDGSYYLNGNGSTANVAGPTAEPVELGEKVSSVVLDHSVIYAITEDNDLYSWGINGRLVGAGSSSNKEPCKILSNIKTVSVYSRYNPGISDAIGVASAISINGDLYTWGENAYGALGLGDYANRTMPEKVKGIGKVNWVRKIFGDSINHKLHIANLCVTSKGELYWWGSTGSRGEESNLPQQVSNRNIIDAMFLDTDSAYILMKDGSIWVVDNFDDDYPTVSILPLPESEISKTYESLSLGSTTAAEQPAVTKTVSFNNLNPNEIYNFYAVKSDTKEKIFEEGNLLYISQGKADEGGNLVITYTLREEYKNPDLFVVGTKKKDIRRAEVSIENLIYNGAEQLIEPTVVYGGTELIEGEDYILAGDFKAAEVGTYSLKIIGTGIFTGMKEVTYQIEPIKYVILFDSDGGSHVEPQVVEAGNCILKPEDPTKDGYLFTGWYYNSEEYDFSTIPTDSITLTAGWTLDDGTTPGDGEKPGQGGNIPGDGDEPGQGGNDPEQGDDESSEKEDNDQESGGTISNDIIIGDFRITGMEKSYIYTGKPHKPAIQVFDEDNLLKKNKDYKITYKNNVNVNPSGSLAGEAFQSGLPTIIIEGKGNYEGRFELNFNILPASLGEGDQISDKVKISYSEQSLTNAKKSIKPLKSIKLNRKLTEGKDYKSLLTAIEAVDSQGRTLMGAMADNAIPAGAKGSFLLTIDGIGNYNGSIIKLVVAGEKTSLMKGAKVSLSKEFKKLDIDTFLTKYEGILPKEAYTVSFAGKELREGEDYTVSCNNIYGTGKAELTITGKGNYLGTKSVPFTITKKSLNSQTLNISGLEDKVYTAADIIQENLKISYGSQEMTEGKDYELIYQKNRNKGKATVIIQAIPYSGYQGSVKKTFKIDAADISTASMFSLDTIVAEYEKAGARPLPGDLYNASGRKLIYGKDYTVSYQNNKQVAESGALMIVKGKGNYKGTLSIPFIIKKTALDSQQISLSVKSIAYKNNKSSSYEYKPAIILKNGKTVLKPGQDYNITYENNSQAAYEEYYINKNTAAPRPAIRITAISDGNYEGELLLQLPVYRHKLNSKNIEVVLKNPVYDGNSLKPDIEVYFKGDSGARVKLNKSEYQLTYGSNITAGKKKGSVKITGTGAGYGGNVTFKFDILSKNLSDNINTGN